MATKSYSKQKEYKEYSSSGTVLPPYTDEQFDMMKSELMPRGSKLDSLGRSGVQGGTREYHYEYKEEKLPSGKYDRKDLHTVEEFTVPPKSIPKASESSSYYYTREERELPSITSGTRTYNYETSNSTPGYSKVRSSKVTKDLSQNVEELDSLLDDLQKDQERQLYKSGYTSDTMETSSFDYKRGTPVKSPSSGYSTLKREERVEASSWAPSPPPAPAPAPLARTAEIRQELYREEKTESRVVPGQVSPAVPLPVPAASCTHCHQSVSGGTLPRGGTPMNKVTTTVKTYTYEVPAGQDPTSLPLPPLADHQHTYVSSSENVHTSSNLLAPASPPAAPSPAPPGCQHCSHCNTHLRQYQQVTTSDEHTSERVLYPPGPRAAPAEPLAAPAPAPAPAPLNGHGPYGPNVYKYSETTYSAQNTTERFPGGSAPPPRQLEPSPSPSPQTRHLTPSPAPFPRPSTPSPGNQQPPKKLDDLLADFPEARFPTQPDGVSRRRVETTRETSAVQAQAQAQPPAPAARSPAVGSRNVAGPAVYYPPGHTPFAKKDPAGYQMQASASAMQGGGAYASGRGMYEYESGARSKEKRSEKTTAVPVCLPLCCAMPCVLL